MQKSINQLAPCQWVNRHCTEIQKPPISNEYHASLVVVESSPAMSSHSCYTRHYMEPTTFMIPPTLHDARYIHGWIYITCNNRHSWYHQHFMHSCTFMPNDTLHGRSHIHALGHIIWGNEHSWIEEHYMQSYTFMFLITLHETTYIHALNYITCVYAHSCLTPHYMSLFTFSFSHVFVKPGIYKFFHNVGDIYLRSLSAHHQCETTG